MKYRLRSLLALVLIVAVGLAAWMWMETRRLHREARQESFRELASRVDELDEGIRARLLEMPEVMADLQVSRPVDPHNGLNHQAMGRSTFFGQYQFSKRFHLDWQLANGGYAAGSTHELRSQLDEDSHDPHVVELSYPPSEINRKIADWIEHSLEADSSVVVVQVEEKPPIGSSSEP